MLCYMEGGLGDAIQFLRYVPLVKAAGGRVVVLVHDRLRPLLHGFSAIDESVQWASFDLGKYDFAVPGLSFPLVAGTTLENIPSASWIPPLPESKRRVAKIRTAGDGFRIGLSWGANEARHSFPLQHLRGLAEVPGVRLFGLQRGPQAKELEAVDFPITNLENAATDILDTAAAMLELDLIISADTMTAHLAGSLGRPVYTLLPRHPDWRWIVGRSDSPWYPTMKVFKQCIPDDWSGPVAEVVAAVRGLAGRA